jgi:hypothetical protein
MFFLNVLFSLFWKYDVNEVLAVAFGLFVDRMFLKAANKEPWMPEYNVKFGSIDSHSPMRGHMGHPEASQVDLENQPVL